MIRLTSHPKQLAQAQQDRDNTLSGLLGSMSAALSSAQRAADTSIIDNDDALLLMTAQKAKECALFVRDYAKTTGFGECLVGLPSPSMSDVSILQYPVLGRTCFQVPTVKSNDSQATLTSYARASTPGLSFHSQKDFRRSMLSCTKSRKE